jgi:hypothetical protein
MKLIIVCILVLIIVLLDSQNPAYRSYLNDAQQATNEKSKPMNPLLIIFLIVLAIWIWKKIFEE